MNILTSSLIRNLTGSLGIRGHLGVPDATGPFGSQMDNDESGSISTPRCPIAIRRILQSRSSANSRAGAISSLTRRWKNASCFDGGCGAEGCSEGVESESGYCFWGNKMSTSEL